MQPQKSEPASSPVQTVSYPDTPTPTPTLTELAELAIDATTTNGMVTALFTASTMSVDLGLNEMVLTLHSQVEAFHRGEMKQAESMLLCQAVTLNAIFTEMARRATLNMNGNLLATETYLRMALKAQNQSRATLETLYETKKPPFLITNLANITTGSQQVNNYVHGQPCNSAKRN